MPVVRLLGGSHLSERNQRIDELLLAHWGRALLLVPTQAYALQREHAFFLEHNLPGAWGPFIYTFAGFVEALLESTGRPVTLVSDTERRLILKQAVANAADSGLLDALGPAGGTEGFLSHLQRVVDSLKQAAVEPPAFAERAQKRTTSGPLDKLVARAYASYQDALQKRDLYDRIGLFWEANVACEKDCPPLLAGIELVVLDGFDDFTVSEFRLLKSLADQVKTLCFGINYDENPERADLYALQIRTLSCLREHFDIIQESSEAPVPRTFSEHAAAYLLWRGSPPEPTDCRPNLALIPCADPVHEAETVARSVKELLLEEKACLHEIVVVFRDPRESAHVIRGAFARFGVPLHLTQAPSLQESAACIFVLALIEADQEWKHTPIEELLASPWLAGEMDPVVQAAPTLARLAGIVAGYSEWERGLQALLERLGESSDDQTTQCLQRMPDAQGAIEAMLARLRRLRDLMMMIPAQGSVPEFAQAVEAVVQASDLLRTASRHPVSAIREQERNALTGLRGLLGLLHDAPPDGDQRIGRRDFATLLRQLMRTAPFEAPHPPHAVECTALERLRNRRFAYVFLCGFNEGVIPSPDPVNAIYGNEDIRELAQCGVPLEPPHIRRDRELAWIQHAIAAAREQLVISWSTIRRDGKETRESPYVEEIRCLFAEHSVQAPTPAPEAFVPSPEHIASVADLRNVAALRSPVLRKHPEAARLLPGINLEGLRHSPQPFDAYDGLLAAPDLRERVERTFGENHVFSVRQLEQYAECPFRFFAERILQVLAVETPMEELDALEHGSLVHAVLQRFHATHTGSSVLDLDPGIARESLFDAIDHVVDDRLRGASRTMQGLMQAERLMLKRLLIHYLHWEGDRDDGHWKPAHFEVAFGGARASSNDPLNRREPYELVTPNGPVRFMGIIDRIDRHDNSVRIIDYKTGTPPTFSKMKEGKAIQLPIYALACEQTLCPDDLCNEARYIQVGKESKKGFLSRNRPEEWEGCMSRVRQAVVGLVAGIRSGAFPPTPEDTACRHCPMASACRHEKVRIERKQSKAPA